jgi:alanine racemase
MCVALLEEGIELRNAGVRCPILVMGGAYGRYRDAMEALVVHELTPVIYDRCQLDSLSAAADYLDRPELVGVHLKVDTGMGRLGVRGEELGQMLEALDRAPRLRLEGLMTHLACADEAEWAVTGQQLHLFEAAASLTRSAGHRGVLCHAANSAALVRWPATHFDAVRPGIALFGVHPCPAHADEGARPPKLRPVLRVRSEIVALRELPAGAPVGYGHIWRAPRPSIVGTIPMGYADGLNRSMAEGGTVLVAGKRAPIVGAVSMDLTTIDLTDHPGVRLHEEVVVLGAGRGRLGSDCIDAGEIAARSGTIPYEVLTSISRRVPRFYRHA